MNDIERLKKMSDAEVQSVWDAIWELSPFDRPDVEWQEDVYSEITIRGLRSGAPARIKKFREGNADEEETEHTTPLAVMARGYRRAERAIADTTRDGKINGRNWPGTRFSRSMHSRVTFPISLATAITMAQDYKEESSALYWGEQTGHMAR